MILTGVFWHRMRCPNRTLKTTFSIARCGCCGGGGCSSCFFRALGHWLFDFSAHAAGVSVGRLQAWFVANTPATAVVGSLVTVRNDIFQCTYSSYAPLKFEKLSRSFRINIIILEGLIQGIHFSRSNITVLTPSPENLVPGCCWLSIRP